MTPTNLLDEAKEGLKVIDGGVEQKWQHAQLVGDREQRVLRESADLLHQAVHDGQGVARAQLARRAANGQFIRAEDRNRYAVRDHDLRDSSGADG